MIVLFVTVVGGDEEGDCEQDEHVDERLQETEGYKHCKVPLITRRPHGGINQKPDGGQYLQENRDADQQVRRLSAQDNIAEEARNYKRARCPVEEKLIRIKAIIYPLLRILEIEVVHDIHCCLVEGCRPQKCLELGN